VRPLQLDAVARGGRRARGAAVRKLQGVGNSTFVLSVENDNDFRSRCEWIFRHLGLVKSYFSSFFGEKKNQEFFFCGAPDAPEDQAICLFAGLLANPDMTLSPRLDLTDEDCRFLFTRLNHLHLMCQHRRVVIHLYNSKSFYNSKSWLEDCLTRLVSWGHIDFDKTKSPTEVWGSDHRENEAGYDWWIPSKHFPSKHACRLFTRLNHHHLMCQHRRMVIDCTRSRIQILFTCRVESFRSVKN
jgi:hypothetical protein